MEILTASLLLGMSKYAYVRLPAGISTQASKQLSNPE